MKILIIEDEILAADRMEKLVLSQNLENKVLAKLRSVESAVAWWRAHPAPDLIISDIQLLDGECFEIFSQVKVETPVIFTTAYDQYAIRAFEVHSLDYLLKPISPEKLAQSLEKVKKYVQAEAPAFSYEQLAELIKPNVKNYKSRFMVKFGNRIVAIPLDEIAYFFSESKLSFIVGKDGKKFVLDQTLQEIEDLLDPKLFFRINRQLVVCFEAISEMHPHFKGRIKLKLKPEFKDEVVVSSERTPEFKRWLEE
jgi:DNA-binding LytR/AlgR family response regulator